VFSLLGAMEFSGRATDNHRPWVSGAAYQPKPKKLSKIPTTTTKPTM
jgi:hypothetical protein